MNSGSDRAVPMSFSQAEKEFAKLKQDYERGKLTDAALKARMQDLMVQDPAGQWWVIGHETSLWYVRVGEEWVQRDRPTGSAAAPSRGAVAVVDQSLWESVFWPATLISMAFLMGSTVARDLLLRTFTGMTECHMSADFLSCALYQLGWIIAIYDLALLGLSTGFLAALTIRFFYRALLWKHVAIVAAGWGLCMLMGGWFIGIF